MEISIGINVTRSIRMTLLAAFATAVGAVGASQVSAQTAQVLCEQWRSGNVYVADDSGECRSPRDVPLQWSPTATAEVDGPETKSLELLNNWLPYGGDHASPTATRHGDVVILQGLVKAGQVGKPLATLPDGWAPESRLVFPSYSLYNRTRVDVLDDGSITVLEGSNLWITLSGIVFTVADAEE